MGFYETEVRTTGHGTSVLTELLMRVFHIPFLSPQPLAFNGSAAQYTLVLGGGFSMWGEYMVRCR